MNVGVPAALDGNVERAQAVEPGGLELPKRHRAHASMYDEHMPSPPLLLHYAGCGTCKKARAWLDKHGIAVELRPIVEQPPTAQELARWIPESGLPVRRWLNTSGQSYRALGKAA